MQGRFKVAVITWTGWSGIVQEVEWAGERLVGGVEQNDGDVPVPGGAEGVDRQVALGGYVLGAAAGTDVRGVLPEGGVTDEVPVLDGPLRPGEVGRTVGARPGERSGP